MTRRSKREIERAVEDLDTLPEGDADAGGPGIVYDTGDEYLDMDGEPVPTDDDGELIPPAWGPIVIFDADPVEDGSGGSDA